MHIFLTSSKALLPDEATQYYFLSLNTNPLFGHSALFEAVRAVFTTAGNEKAKLW